MVQVEIHPSCREASGIARRRAVFDDWDASPESREFPRRWSRTDATHSQRSPPL